MYHVSAQGVDERMVNVHYHSLYMYIFDRFFVNLYMTPTFSFKRNKAVLDLRS